MSFVIMAVVVSIYLILSAVRDIKERQVYSTFAVMFAGIIMLYLLWEGQIDRPVIVMDVVIHFILMVALNSFKVWGAGDSDFLVLLGATILTLNTELIPDGLSVAIVECLSLSLALMLSVAIGKVESLCRKNKLTIQSGVAVVPGMAVVMIAMLVSGIVWRCM